MENVIEGRRYPAPAGRPQPLAFHDATLWIGCWDTSRLYAIDTNTWKVRGDVAAPGKPFGLVSFEGAIRMVVSIGDDDDRYFFRFVPGEGIDLASKIPCPELTGSHLASDGSTLFMTQMTNGRILALDGDYAVQREIALPTRCAGIGCAANRLYMISADEEFEDLAFGTLDSGSDAPAFTRLAAISPESRGLAFDGHAWWTNQRETNEVMSFAATPTV